MFNKIKNNKPLIQVLIYLILVITFLVENNINLGGHNIHSSLDDMIPFVPVFIIPYSFWFLFIVVTSIIFLLKSKDDLRKTFLSMNICMVIALLIYLIYPNYISIRPNVYGNDIFSQAVKFLQQGDSSSSVCPSLHVAISISLYTGIANSICFSKRSGIKLFTLILTILIIISTVFIKQHSIVDVAFGIILGLVSYVFVYKIHFNEKLFSRRVEETKNEL